MKEIEGDGRIWEDMDAQDDIGAQWEDTGGQDDMETLWEDVGAQHLWDLCKARGLNPTPRAPRPSVGPFS